MKFGLLLDARDPEAMLALARTAESAGFDSVWLAEERSSDDGACPAPQVAAAATAAATGVIRIGVIAQLGLSHPLYTAEDIAVLDNISNGRTLIMATKPSPQEAAARGLAPESIGERFREALEICLAAWSPVPFRHEGRHFRVPANLAENVHAAAFTHISVTPKPAQPRLPLWVTAGDEGDVRHAAQLGLPIAGGDEPIGQLQTRFDLYRSLTAASAGQPLAVTRRLEAVDDSLHEEIEGCRNRLGAQYLIIRPGGAADAETVERFGKEVIPVFRMFGYPPELRSASS